MFKYRFFQVILAIAVVMLIVSSAVFISFQGVNISEAEYTSEMTGRTFETDEADGSETALTEFEAWLEYSIIADGLKETGNNVDFDKGNVKLYDYNLTQLRQLKKVKDEAKRMMFLSVILLIIGFLAVKKRRMYECVVWGGVAASVIGMVSLILLAVSGSGIFYGVRDHGSRGMPLSGESPQCRRRRYRSSTAPENVWSLQGYPSLKGLRGFSARRLRSRLSRWRGFR